MAQKGAAASIQVELVKDRETKNTVRYAEEGEDTILGIVYIPKTTLAEIGTPDRISITIEAA